MSRRPTTLPLTDFESLRARFRNQSFWKLHYVDGTVLSERTSDWALAPYAGRKAVRLFCPDGSVAEFGSADSTGRLFQFKVAEVRGNGWHGTLAHVVGLVDEGATTCDFAAWRYDQRKLVYGRDDVAKFSFLNVGALNTKVLGLK